MNYYDYWSKTSVSLDYRSEDLILKNPILTTMQNRKISKQISRGKEILPFSTAGIVKRICAFLTMTEAEEQVLLPLCFHLDFISFIYNKYICLDSNDQTYVLEKACGTTN